MKKIGILTNYLHAYWHMHLPVSVVFIEYSKAPFVIKQLFVHTLINQVEH
ncbi:DUF3916 domain-containing protein [Viridibacillus arvi]